MFTYENGYLGVKARKHQKMRPSKRRKLNTAGEYDTTVILEPKCDVEITLPDGRKVGIEIKTGIITTFTPNRAE